MRHPTIGSFLLGALAVSSAACSDQTGPNGAVPTTVTLSQVAAPAVQISGLLRADGALRAAMALVDPDQVDSLVVSVERVEVLPAAADTGGDGQWIEIPTVAPASIDLMALPTDEADGIALAAGDLEPGDFGSVRLFIGSAQIWFNTEISAPGNGGTFSADEPYDVVIPSSSQSGIKTDAGFTVPDTGGDIPLTFDADATIRHVSVTGSGKIMVPPVIKAKGGS